MKRQRPNPVTITQADLDAHAVLIQGFAQRIEAAATCVTTNVATINTTPKLP